MQWHQLIVKAVKSLNIIEHFQTPSHRVSHVHGDIFGLFPVAYFDFFYTVVLNNIIALKHR